jgi:hypothetical protein
VAPKSTAEVTLPAMTTKFALDLSLDGIRLLYLAEGGWTVVGDAAIEDPALDQRLAGLRAQAEGLAGEPVGTQLVIPPSQIRYARVPRPAADPVTAADLAPAIAGLTPLDPSELAFDWEVEGEEVRIALVDRQTLDEAEAFATAYGFNPAGFSARPTPAQFPRIPDFGRPSRAAVVPAMPPAPAPAAGLRVSEPAPRLDATGAEALARSLSAPRPGEAEAPPAARRRPRLRSVALGAGGLAAAALALAVSLGRPSDPAASIPDIAPDVALSLPALAAPGATEASPAAPAALDDVPVAVETAAVPPPAAVADPAADSEAPAALAEVPPARIVSTSPARPAPPASGTSEAIYLASIDPVTRATDAIALPAVASFATPTRPARPTPPAPAGGAPADAAATATASLTADDPAAEVVVVEGPPPLAPPQRAAEALPAPEEPADTQPAPAEVAASLPERRPRARPAGLAERYERAIFAGRTRAEMAELRPLARPVSAQAAAATEAPAPPTDQAVARSLAPRDRPADLATRIATAQAVAEALAAPPPQAPTPAPAPQVAAAAPAPAAAAQPQASAPKPDDEYDDGETDVASAAPDIPTSASVARQATIRNAIAMRDINLIGVYGTERDRRALVRLSNGRFVKVKVGDRLDGGRIATIGRDELRYTKGGRNITLSVPSG